MVLNESLSFLLDIFIQLDKTKMQDDPTGTKLMKMLMGIFCHFLGNQLLESTKSKLDLGLEQQATREVLKVICSYTQTVW